MIKKKKVLVSMLSAGAVTSGIIVSTVAQACNVSVVSPFNDENPDRTESIINSMNAISNYHEEDITTEIGIQVVNSIFVKTSNTLGFQAPIKTINFDNINEKNVVFEPITFSNVVYYKINIENVTVDAGLDENITSSLNLKVGYWNTGEIRVVDIDEFNMNTSNLLIMALDTLSSYDNSQKINGVEAHILDQFRWNLTFFVGFFFYKKLDVKSLSFSSYEIISNPNGGDFPVQVSLKNAIFEVIAEKEIFTFTDANFTFDLRGSISSPIFSINNADWTAAAIPSLLTHMNFFSKRGNGFNLLSPFYYFTLESLEILLPLISIPYQYLVVFEYKFDLLVEEDIISSENTYTISLNNFQLNLTNSDTLENIWTTSNDVSFRVRLYDNSFDYIEASAHGIIL